MANSATPGTGASTWNPYAAPPVNMDLGEVLKPGTLAALTDIAGRSGNLLSLYSEKLASADNDQPIDPQTVAKTVQEFVQQAKVNPLDLLKQQSTLTSDLAQLWQRTATQMLSNTPALPCRPECCLRKGQPDLVGQRSAGKWLRVARVYCRARRIADDESADCGGPSVHRSAAAR